MLRNFLIVGLGGFLGSMLRYGAGVLIKSLSFPVATFAVNIIGCFVIGLVYGMSLKNPDFSLNWKLFLATGICGGFTTFSAFSVEGVQMLQQGRYLIFFLYFALSIILGLAATWLGVRIVQA